MRRNFVSGARLIRNFTFRGESTSWRSTLRISTRRPPSERSFRVNRRRLLTQIRSRVVDLFPPRRNGCTRYINFLRFDRFLRESPSDRIARFRNSSPFLNAMATPRNSVVHFVRSFDRFRCRSSCSSLDIF